ncbi:hypothetical protein [Actinacidiphila yeochonensis]|uniref:hypothetical protein n=1 Tax=Actinacidiphila yeochonensis TaxID=89050 RepID=UPI00056A879D|nr:hypothetical protein [Actinacidiphila yeochonensis]
MAFSADEVRVLRRALADTLSPAAGAPAPRDAGYVRDCLRLADTLAEAVDEAARLHAFHRAELARYRAALPGAAGGYLDRLTAALDGGATPGAEDLAALRQLRAVPCGPAERRRRLALLRRCETLAENDVRQRLEAHMRSDRRLLTLPPRSVPGPAAPRRAAAVLAVVPRAAGEPDPARPPRPSPPPGRRRSRATGRPRSPARGPGARRRAGAEARRAGRPARPGARGAAPGRPRPAPGRRAPTPAEVFPPSRRRGAPGQARSA